MTTSLRGHENLLQLIAICHHPDKSCGYKHCDSGDIMFLNCHVTSHEHILEGLYELLGGRPLR